MVIFEKRTDPPENEQKALDWKETVRAREWALQIRDTHVFDFTLDIDFLAKAYLLFVKETGNEPKLEEPDPQFNKYVTRSSAQEVFDLPKDELGRAIPGYKKEFCLSGMLHPTAC